jgi:HSP20 family protein
MFPDVHPLDDAQREGQLAVDVMETRDKIIIRTAVAGVTPEALDVHVTSEIVTIRGERKTESTSHDTTMHYQECFWGTFSRSIVLPHQVNPDEADAVFKDGVLTLTIPKLRGEMNVQIRRDI